MSPFYALYGYSPLIRINIKADVPGGEAPSARARIEKLANERDTLLQHWKRASDTQQKWYNKKHTPRTFTMGDKVMLSAKNIRQLRPSKKLADRYLRPFEVVAVISTHGQAYKLKLPLTYRIHPVFHVLMLEPYHPRTNASEESPALIDIEGENGEFWEVETILAHRDKSKSIGREYYVWWKGFAPTEDSWEPAKSFYDQTMVAEYKRTASEQTRTPRRPRKRPRTQ
jgi:hypothetical protein